MVTVVKRGTPAYEAGVNVGDEILAIDDYRVPPDGLEGRLKVYRPEEKATLLVARRERLTRLPVTFGREAPGALDAGGPAPTPRRTRRPTWRPGWTGRTSDRRSDQLQQVPELLALGAQVGAAALGRAAPPAARARRSPGRSRRGAMYLLGLLVIRRILRTPRSRRIWAPMP